MTHLCNIFQSFLMGNLPVPEIGRNLLVLVQDALVRVSENGVIAHAVDIGLVHPHVTKQVMPKFHSQNIIPSMSPPFCHIYAPVLDKRVPLASREKVIPSRLIKDQRRRDPKRRLRVLELPPADAVHAAHEDGADVEPGAAVLVQAGAPQQVGAVRAHGRAVHAPLDKYFRQQVRAHVAERVVGRVREVVKDANFPARVHAHPVDHVALAPGMRWF